MAIIRSSIKTVKMKDKIVKVKRKRVNWMKVINDSRNFDLYKKFFDFCNDNRHSKRMSRNRIAYYVLKSYYRTTTIDELLEKVNFDTFRRTYGV